MKRRVIKDLNIHLALKKDISECNHYVAMSFSFSYGFRISTIFHQSYVRPTYVYLDFEVRSLFADAHIYDFYAVIRQRSASLLYRLRTSTEFKAHYPSAGTRLWCASGCSCMPLHHGLLIRLIIFCCYYLNFNYINNVFLVAHFIEIEKDIFFILNFVLYECI